MKIDHHQMTALLTFGAFGSYTFVFSLMWVTGAVQAVEPNSWARGLELGASVFLMLYGLWRLKVEEGRK